MTIRIENKNSASWLSFLSKPIIYNSSETALLVVFKKGEKKITRKDNRINMSCIKSVKAGSKIYDSKEYGLLVYLTDDEVKLVSEMGDQKVFAVFPNGVKYSVEENRRAFMVDIK